VGFVVDKIALGLVFRSTSDASPNSHFTNRSAFIIHHPGLVQEAKKLPTYKMGSV
jgi:hypothetical protein